jgi:hypothetical protein
MHRWLANLLIALSLAGVTFLGIRAATGGEATEPGAIDCVAWYDHFTASTNEIPPFADARARMSADQLEQARAGYLGACVQVVADPASYAEDLAVLTCTLGATDAAAWIACVDPRPPERKAPDGEAAVLLSAIRTAEKAYDAEWDTFLPCAPTPAELPGAAAAPFSGGGLEDFYTLGWIPDGDVVCRYSVVTLDGGRDFEAIAECDEDGDGEIARWRATNADRPAPTTPEEVR